MHYGMPLSAQAAPVDTGPGKPGLVVGGLAEQGFPAAVASAGDGGGGWLASWSRSVASMLAGRWARASGTGGVSWSSSTDSPRPGPGRWHVRTATARTCCSRLKSTWACAFRRLCARLYLVLGKRRDLTARQDPLLPLERLRMDQTGGVIVFRRENQGCAEWGVAAADPWNPEDPPVYVRQPGGRPWEPFATRMSLACADLVLSEVLLGAQFMAMCDLSGSSAVAAATTLGQSARQSPASGKGFTYPPDAAPGFQATVRPAPERMICAQRSARSALHPTAYTRRPACHTGTWLCADGVVARAAASLHAMHGKVTSRPTILSIGRF
jgi:hypothetical protein